MRRSCVSLLFVGFSVFVVARNVSAQDSLEAARVAGTKPLASGDVASNSAKTVRVAGQGSLSVAKIAERVFVKPRALAKAIEGTRGALLGKPKVEERFTETARATVFVSTTTITVTDPEKLRKGVPEFASYHQGISDRGSFKLSELGNAEKKEFDAFKAGLSALSSKHPLKIAATNGDAALLDAVARGEGDVSIVITASIPKESLPESAGKSQKPRLNKGLFDYAALDPWAPKLPLTGAIAAPRIVVDGADEDPGKPGKKKFVGNLVTGFTEESDFEWEERWNFPSGFFSVGVGAYYAFGLRVPLQVTAEIDPVQIMHITQPDTTFDVTTTLALLPVDGNKQFYLDAGMAASDAKDGEELLIEAGVYATVKVHAGWGAIKVNETFPKNLGFDFSKDFQPPFGDCGTRCGFDVWVPANVTHTGIDIVGLVEGSVQLGFNVSGRGEAAIDYTSLFDGDPIQSALAARHTTHKLVFGGPGSKLVRTTLPALNEPGTEKFGYRLDDPSYEWKISVTPGVKGTVKVNAKPFFKLDEVIGPFWLPFLDVDLGTVKLQAHRGTNTEYKRQPGRKTLSVLTLGTTLPPVIKPKK